MDERKDEFCLCTPVNCLTCCFGNNLATFYKPSKPPVRLKKEKERNCHPMREKEAMGNLLAQGTWSRENLLLKWRKRLSLGPGVEGNLPR